MRKILFVFSLFLSLSLILACSDDDNSDPKLSFGRPIYILKAAEPLAVELIVSEPVTEEIKVPFMIDGLLFWMKITRFQPRSSCFIPAIGLIRFG